MMIGTDKGCKSKEEEKQFYVQSKSKFNDCLKTQICQFEHLLFSPTFSHYILDVWEKRAKKSFPFC